MPDGWWTIDAPDGLPRALRLGRRLLRAGGRRCACTRRAVPRPRRAPGRSRSSRARARANMTPAMRTATITLEPYMRDRERAPPGDRDRPPRRGVRDRRAERGQRPGQRRGRRRRQRGRVHLQVPEAAADRTAGPARRHPIPGAAAQADDLRPHQGAALHRHRAGRRQRGGRPPAAGRVPATPLDPGLGTADHSDPDRRRRRCLASAPEHHEGAGLDRREDVRRAAAARGGRAQDGQAGAGGDGQGPGRDNPRHDPQGRAQRSTRARK